MKKSDKSIHNICLTAIKRSTRTPYDFRWTRFYEEKEAFTSLYTGMIADMEEEELPICSTIIDADNWSVLTTRRIITTQNGYLTSALISPGSSSFSFEIKNARKEKVISRVTFKNGNTIDYFIESGAASMVMVYGIDTRLGMESITNED